MVGLLNRIHKYLLQRALMREMRLVKWALERLCYPHMNVVTEIMEYAERATPDDIKELIEIGQQDNPRYYLIDGNVAYGYFHVVYHLVVAAIRYAETQSIEGMLDYWRRTQDDPDWRIPFAVMDLAVASKLKGADPILIQALLSPNPQIADATRRKIHQWRRRREAARLIAKAERMRAG